MAAAEKEEKEEGVLVEVWRLISISGVDSVFLHVGGYENDGIGLHTTDPVSTLTTLTTSDVSFINLFWIFEKLQVFPSTPEEVLVVTQTCQSPCKTLSTSPNFLESKKLASSVK